MKNYKEFLTRLEYAKSMYGIYGFEKYLYENELFFRLFMSLGFENLFSYYSMVLHERYYKKVGDKELFVWRDGSYYSFEFSHEPIGVIRDLKDEVPIRQSDPFTIHLSAFSSYTINVINNTFFTLV